MDYGRTEVNLQFPICDDGGESMDTMAMVNGGLITEIMQCGERVFDVVSGLRNDILGLKM